MQRRRVVTLPARWPFPATRHWEYPHSQHQVVLDKLPRLTHTELWEVAGKIADLLLVKEGA